MKYIITATAPTSYQLNSLRAFNLNGTGMTRTMEFGSEEEAKDYLKTRADKYNDEDPCGSEERLEEMYSDIESGSLRLDAVSAYIEEQND